MAYTKEQLVELEKSLTYFQGEAEAKKLIKSIKEKNQELSNDEKDKKENTTQEDLVKSLVGPLTKAIKEELEKDGFSKSVDNKDDEKKDEKDEEGKGDKPKDDLSKGLDSDLTKSISEKFDTLTKSLSPITDSIKAIGERQDNIEKSIKEYLNSPAGQFKGFLGDYNVIEKGIKKDEKGDKVISVSLNRDAALDEMEKAFNKSNNAQEKQVLENGITQLSFAGSCSDEAIALTKSLTGNTLEK